jgi:hypothetical protein
MGQDASEERCTALDAETLLQLDHRLNELGTCPFRGGA